MVGALFYFVKYLTLPKVFITFVFYLYLFKILSYGNKKNTHRPIYLYGRGARRNPIGNGYARDNWHCEENN
ncbi:MAG: hypothetical protein IMZ64_08740 [Bacteroidetes bacterium]|nr:hypothetical protein [Bacteroidota bacterium]